MGEVERRCGQLASAQWGIITRGQALDLGLSRNEIDRRVKTKSWSSVHRGVFRVLPSDDEWLSDVTAAVLATGGVASGPCAAAIWKLDGFDRPQPIEVVTRFDRRLLASTSARVHRVDWLTDAMCTKRERVPVLNPVHMLLHLGDSASRDDVEVALDCCLRRNLVHFTGLDELCRSFGSQGHRGVARLRELLALRMPLKRHTDSILETRLLQRLREFGFPAPVLQYAVRQGRFVIAHSDLAFPKQRLLIEAVGKNAHASELRQLTRDCRRANALALLRQYTVLSFTWYQVHHAPEEIRAAVARALATSSPR